MNVQRGIGLARDIGRVARTVQSKAYQGAELTKRLGQGAGEYNRSRLGSFIAHRSPLAGRISRGIEMKAPQVERGLRRLGDIAGRVKELENVELKSS